MFLQGNAQLHKCLSLSAEVNVSVNNPGANVTLTWSYFCLSVKLWDSQTMT